jgi:NADPH:quinone reductase-like Zn-dependent oxidoreductase
MTNDKGRMIHMVFGPFCACFGIRHSIFFRHSSFVIRYCTMKSLLFDRFGPPVEVLHLQDVPIPEPARGQVRIRMIAAPINPSDLLVVRGQYGRLPPLPATPGFEGVGVVDAVGGGLIAKLRGLRRGRRVAVLNGRGGNWQEQVVISAREAVPVSDAIPDEQVASFFVNPATALVMTRRVLRVPAGAWLLQTAAGSALGRMVIRLGRHCGFHTINVVRRRDQADELKRLGGDEVVCTDDEIIEDRVREITGAAGVRYALDAVGGTMGLGAVRSLRAGGKLLVYGTLSGEPIPLDPRLLMVGQKCVQGFWLSEWVKQQGVWTMLGLFREINRLLARGVLFSPVQARFSLDQVTEAVRLAETPGRTGKVLLNLAAAGK